MLLLLLLLGDVEVDQLSLFPILRPFLTIFLDQLALTMPDIVLVRAGEDIAAAECVDTRSLLDPIIPISLIPFTKIN